MARARNSQFSKFWKCDAVLDGIARSYGSEAATIAAIERARKSAFLNRRYPELSRRPIDVTFKGKKVVALRDSIHLPLNKCNDHVVARQIARLLFYRRDRSAQWAWHGWQFCAIYLDVIHVVMGKAAREWMEGVFRANGVRWKEKKARVATPEMLAALVKAREARRSNSN